MLRRRVALVASAPSSAVSPPGNLSLGRLWLYRSRMRELLLLLLIVPAAAGCVEAFGDKNPHEPGEALGTFHLAAKQTQNTCGAGALGSTAAWEFDVKLARDDEHVYWNSGGQIIVGTLAEDGESFEIASDVVMDMRTADDAGKPACSVDRADGAKGKLVLDADTVASFNGTLTYAFAPTAGSSCGDLVVSETPVLAALPCAMAYTFTAPRTVAP